jgi:hypothetical protein
VKVIIPSLFMGIYFIYLITVSFTAAAHVITITKVYTSELKKADDALLQAFP